MRNYQTKTLDIIDQCRATITQYSPSRVTVRQIFYRLVAAQVISNNLNSYKRLDAILGNARKDGYIAFGDIVDNTRRMIKPQCWDDLASFFGSIQISYARDLQTSQENYVEVWLEKDALANQLSEVTAEYRVPLVIGRGYQSWSFLYEAAQRFNDQARGITILYFGDFDPSGEDIFRDIQDRLEDQFDVVADFRKIALTQIDIEEYKLPPDFTKKTDTRANSFIAKYGDVAVELDALPPDILERKVRESIEEYLDLDLLKAEQETEREEQQRLEEILDNLDV